MGGCVVTLLRPLTTHQLHRTLILSTVDCGVTLLRPLTTHQLHRTLILSTVDCVTTLLRPLTTHQLHGTLILSTVGCVMTQSSFQLVESSGNSSRPILVAALLHNCCWETQL